MPDSESVTAPPYDPAIAAELATEAYSIAAEAGAAILDALGSEIFVSYKDTASGANAPANPVSDIDQAVERLIRDRIAARYPDHAFFGEETEGDYQPGPRFTWAVDPIDGTQNFVNGFPFYSSSIGVFDGAVPVAGAIWGVATHLGRPGVYHAHRGGPLHFDGEPMPRHGHFSNGRLRALAAIPMGHQRRAANWDYRSLGSTALEGALVAAGALTAARNPDPHVWDIAASAVLVEAAGHEVWTRPKGGAGWVPLVTIDPAAFAAWRQPVIVTSAAASEEIRKS
ncbi:MAG: inositol monophosphatase [Chloroflexi bacterium]|nr:inositol monophosphatase [Chloroflexota bacterium]MDA1148181.1 inositol monophosphatase [Chloroflexota bacterium]